MESCTKYLEGKLKLKVNIEKSQTGNPLKLKFLGFSLYNAKGTIKIRPHEQSFQRFKDKIRELTCRKRALPVEEILRRIKRYTTGWLGYYAVASMKTRIHYLNEWIRRRIRQIFWKQWKRFSTKHDNLVRLGIADSIAWQWAYTRKAYWRIAGSWILTRTLTNEYLASVGYDDIAKRYEVLHSNH